ncbi:MAG: restriction endonuclease subunit S [Rhodobacteraceae bacterium]|nr:restriction endonuclease subunit S [Paracoccaceae bacterium]
MTEWQTVHIEEIAKKIAMGPFGSNIKVKTFVFTGVPIISGQHLHNSRLDESAGYNFITKEHAAKLSNSNVFPGDVVFTHAGTIGQVALIPEAAAYYRYVLSQRQFYLRVDLSKADPAFVARWFHSPIGKHRLLMHASQVGVPSISRPASNLKTIKIEGIIYLTIWHQALHCD